MTTRESKSRSRKRPAKAQRAEGHQDLYANHVGITITPWDFAFQFGKILEATEKELTIEEAVAVFMSPQHAKAFLALLGRQIVFYEEKYGPIPEPQVPSD